MFRRFNSILRPLTDLRSTRADMGGDECMLGTRLMVTIDVEADSDKYWGTPEVPTFRNVLEAIPNKLQPLFAQYGVRPTYMISPEVLQHEESCATLRSLTHCEMAAHLHPENIPPEAVMVGPSRPRRGMQWECRPEIERQKLENLTRLFVEVFGRNPISFRAGRFGIGHHTGKFLMELGYRVDSSVTPHMRWTNQSGTPFPDFTDAREQPYWVAGGGDLFNSGDSHFLEVPVTIPLIRQVVRKGKKHDLFGTRVKGPVWFRPWYTPTKVLQQIVRETAHSKPEAGMRRPLVMMFHSMEVQAGASPYPQTDAEVDVYLDVLRAVFDTAAKLGIECCTLSEYWQQCRAAACQERCVHDE